MKKPLKLIHLANFNSTNIGNGALISGLEHLLNEDFPRKIEWKQEPWDDYTFGFRKFDRRFVDLVNAHDGLFVNGAVAIHGRAYLKETGMRFELPLAMWTEIKKPVIFYGISYRHFQGQPFHNQEALCGYLAFLASRPNVFLGVRNDGTRKWLGQTLRLEDDVLKAVHEIPDSGVFVQARRGDYPEIAPGRPVMIFSPNGEDAPYRFGDPNRHGCRQRGYVLNEEKEPGLEFHWQTNRARLAHALKNALTTVLKRTDAQLLLVPHYLDDLKFIADLVESFEPQVAHQMTITTGLMRVAGTARFYGRYAAADMAVSMRVHSMSPCIGLGVPMIPLVTQPRMWDFLANVGLDDLAVDAFAEGLETELTEQCLQVLDDPGERRERFMQARKRMREEVKAINSMIFRMFNSE